MKKILLILSLIFFTSYFRADHSISEYCHGVLSNFKNIPSDGMVPISILPNAGSYSSNTLVPSAALFSSAPSIIYSNEIETYDASMRLCFPDVLIALKTNTGGIGDNQGLISKAQQAIVVNTNNISRNLLTINSIQLDNLMQFTKLSSGVASSIAISNIDYADEGWSIGVGAGNFNSETEYAFGLSFASENTSFKIATSKDSSSLGINYKFGR